MKSLMILALLSFPAAAADNIQCGVWESRSFAAYNAGCEPFCYSEQGPSHVAIRFMDPDRTNYVQYDGGRISYEVAYGIDGITMKFKAVHEGKIFEDNQTFDAAQKVAIARIELKTEYGPGELVRLSLVCEAR